MSNAQKDLQRPDFVFEITNKGNQPLRVRTYTSDFQEINGVGTARCGVKWEKPGIDYFKNTAIGPGETVKELFSVGQGYRLKTTRGYILLVKFAENGDY